MRDVNLKTIGIVTEKTSRTSKFICENIYEVFGNYVKVNIYIIDNLKEGEIIKDDVILVPIKDVALKLKKYVDDSKKIIVLSRTVLEEQIYKVYSIPEGMDVLVVNDNKETTSEVFTLLYTLGIKHLNLIPYDKSNEYKNVKIAITPEEEKYVPNYIEKIINIGQRCVDTSTFIEIINKLNIDKNDITKRLIQYSEKIINLDAGIRKNYKKLHLKNEELDNVINLSREGILLTDNNGKIAVCNKVFRDIFELNKDIVGTNIKNIENIGFEKYFKADEIQDEIFKFKNKYLNLNKVNTETLGQKTGMYFNIQEITYIKQLEQNLSKKLKEKGQVARYSFNNIITKSLQMKNCIEIAKKVATSDLTVILTGESGTGKEIVAQSIHNESKRKNQPFIAINCAAMPENLLESEFFGYEEGTFTGALKGGKQGIFEQSNNGTLFLDEIGDMPIYLQTKLLRVLQEKQVMRIGSQKVIDINVRIIAATHRNLQGMVRNGEFRSDLYYRLNVLPINIPPLKDRKDDILLLIKKYLDRNLELDDEVKKILIEYNWPGNIRELINVTSYMSLMTSGNLVTKNDLPFYLFNSNEDFKCEIDIITKKTSLNQTTKVMEVLDKYNNLGIHMGRRQIVKEIEDDDYEITEGKVRKILDVLNELNLIVSNKGRKGTSLSEKGKKFLNGIKNRS